MRSTLLFVLSVMSAGVITSPAPLEARALPTCSRDNLYRSLIDPRFSSTASDFCSSYLRPTITTGTTTTIPITTTTTTTTTQISTTTTFVKPVVLTKRAGTTDPFMAITTYGPSRLSRACSCVISSPSPTFTKFSTTVVVTTTTTQTATTTTVDVATQTLYCGVNGEVSQATVLQFLFVNNAAECLGKCGVGCVGVLYFDEALACETYSEFNFVPIPESPWVGYHSGCPRP